MTIVKVEPSCAEHFLMDEWSAQCFVRLSFVTPGYCDEKRDLLRLDRQFGTSSSEMTDESASKEKAN